MGAGSAAADGEYMPAVCVCPAAMRMTAGEFLNTTLLMHLRLLTLRAASRLPPARLDDPRSPALFVPLLFASLL